MTDVMESMSMNEVFNVSLHVPSLRVDEMVKVLRSLDVFSVMDIPQAVDLLTSIHSKVRGSWRPAGGTGRRIVGTDSKTVRVGKVGACGLAGVRWD